MPKYATAVMIPRIAVIAGRSWKATDTGSRKNTGSNSVLPAPDARHSITTAAISAEVAAGATQSATCPRTAIPTHTTADSVYAASTP
ncbi:Uncharacterised protein [Mycobacteroides abscessus]|nr:Uncharacterised protein [Mycobacteroides abscessus]CPX16214.1 Uncharacterised protein [Mycobacteroides abscessus]SHU54952.1 Uncharacterised protein [Mycobacteroides abscessus subsp. abscessus]